MSALSDHTSILTNSCSENLSHTCNDYLMKVMNIWSIIYGANDVNLDKRLRDLEINHEEFWKEQIEQMENSKKSLANSIESLGRQALTIEKALGLKSGLGNIEDIPLAELEERLWKLLESYSELKEKRIIKFNELKEKEKVLCSALDEKCQLEDALSKSMKDAAGNTFSPQIRVPTNEDMTQAEERMIYLEGLMDELQNGFMNAEEELRQLLEDCEVLPLGLPERFACYDIGEVEFNCTKSNYDLLTVHVEKFRNIKSEAVSKSESLKDQISKLWIKMLKSRTELQEFLDENEGFKKSTLTKLGNKLKSLQTERNSNFKELILQQRRLLDELWTKCQYTDDQRNEFRAYNSNCFSEAVLEEHELQVEQLQLHLSKHKRIYQLVERYFELWKRVLHLEDLAKHYVYDRLFKNRRGQLLQEEKERKTVQKKLPAIKEELITLLNQYRLTEGDDFLYLGTPVLTTLEEMEEQRIASKENEKLQRKAASGAENMQFDCRLGKRKLLIPQHQNVSKKIAKVSSSSSTLSLQSASQVKRPKKNEDRRPRITPEELTFAVPRTPSKAVTTAVTPSNHGSPTYESFQEHIGTVCKEEYLSSTLDPSAHSHVTRSATRSQKKATPFQNKTIFKTPGKTPTKTPTKIPFRIATGSKIPSVVPPMSPRSASKSTRRNKLPIIF